MSDQKAPEVDEVIREINEILHTRIPNGPAVLRQPFTGRGTWIYSTVKPVILPIQRPPQCINASVRNENVNAVKMVPVSKVKKTIPEIQTPKDQIVLHDESQETTFDLPTSHTTSKVLSPLSETNGCENVEPPRDEYEEFYQQIDDSLARAMEVYAYEYRMDPTAFSHLQNRR